MEKKFNVRKCSNNTNNKKEKFSNNIILSFSRFLSLQNKNQIFLYILYYIINYIFPIQILTKKFRHNIL